MNIVMISNYINHHQIPFSNALYEREDVTYTFIQTEPMEEERVKMGWGLDPKSLPYVKLLYEEEQTCKVLIDTCDMLLVGWMEREDLIKDRLEADKLTIRMSERLYREGQYKAISPRGLIRKYKEHTKYRKGNVYLLCFGAYAGEVRLPGADLWLYPRHRRVAGQRKGSHQLQNRHGGSDHRCP